jgi:hypothetical protein
MSFPCIGVGLRVDRHPAELSAVSSNATWMARRLIPPR